METWAVALVTAVVTMVGSVAASTGFWNYLQKKTDRKSASTKLLLGLAHDRIIFLSLSYVDRGWITKDEYEDFFKYLYGPYSEFGGNGLAEKMMEEVVKLPITGGRLDAQHFMKERNERRHDRGPHDG